MGWTRPRQRYHRWRYRRNPLSEALSGTASGTGGGTDRYRRRGMAISTLAALPRQLPPKLPFWTFIRYRQRQLERYHLVPGAWDESKLARAGGTTGYPSGTTASAGACSPDLP